MNQRYMLMSKKLEQMKQQISSNRLSALIPTQIIEQEKEPRKSSVEVQQSPKKTVKKKIPSTITSFQIYDEHHKAIKALAYWQRKNIHEVVNFAFSAYIKSIPEEELAQALEIYKQSQS